MGYLLRLSHRLDVPPLNLARHIGLHTQPTGGHLHQKLLLKLADQQIDLLARATRLTPTEAAGLTLDGWRDRYLPIARSQPHQTRISWSDAWITLGIPRYCPQCLAGKDSADQVHSGVWKKEWHLRVVFACLEHACFLQHACPGPRHRAPSVSARYGLIIRSGDHVRHPALCRHWNTPRGRRREICDIRLDQQQPTAPTPSREALDLQQHILSHLHPSRPAREAAAYFTDLRLITAILTASWPRARHLIDTELVAPVDAHLHRLDERQSSLPSSRNRSYRYYRHLDVPPEDAASTAALLGAAHTVLHSSDLPRALAQYFDTAFGHPRTRAAWKRLYDQHAADCSDRLQAAARILNHPFASSVPRFPPNSGYRAEQIPAQLENHWYQQHLSHIDALPIKVLRRVAAVRLVQQAQDSSIEDAARFLGINPERITYTITSNTHKWAITDEARQDLEMALRELAGTLRKASLRIDYRRRDQLRNWALDPQIWTELTSYLPRIPGPIRPSLDDRKRQEALVFVWVQVTGGEPILAPRPIAEAKPPEVQRAWDARRHTTWFQLTRPDPLRHYGDLRKILTEYSKRLAEVIDASAPLASRTT
ncbi:MULTISPECIES: TniQ family protein [Streptomyces]